MYTYFHYKYKQTVTIAALSMYRDDGKPHLTFRQKTEGECHLHYCNKLVTTLSVADVGQTDSNRFMDDGQGVKSYFIC